MTVDLYQLDGAWGTSSVSPFCIKLEAYLRMAEIPFRSHFGDPRKAKRGKVPWLLLDGETIEDSGLAVRALQERGVGLPLDARLTPDEHARGHALRRMFETGTYFALVYQRWQLDAGWAAYKPYFLARIPRPVGALIVPMLRRNVKRQLWEQGTGRFDEAQVDDMIVSDFTAFSRALGDADFLFGDRPTSFDAVAYAFTTALLGFPVASRATEAVRSLPNVVTFRQRVEARYFR